ncbi:MAG: prepilin-type N-terminal cleavage/methylation domain-containing protein [Bacilli bacterium]
MKNKNNYGFTLIELLGVIVILGIISSIAIVSYNGYVSSTRKTAYETAEKSMKEAAEGMFTDCMYDSNASTLCNSYTAPNVDQSKRVTLKDLVNADYLDNISDPQNKGSLCDQDKSYVFVYAEAPLGGSDNQNLTYKSCLACGKYTSKSCEFDLIPNKDFGINVELRLDSEKGTTYNGEWTNHKVWAKVTSGDPYQFGIKRIELARKITGPWNETSSSFIWNEEGTTKLYVRAIDYANNISEVVPLIIKVDTTAPTGDFAISGTMGNNNWYRSNVHIIPSNVSDANSGVATATVNYPDIDIDTRGIKIILTMRDNAGNVSTKETTIKMDKTNPTCSSSGGSSSWTSSNLTITGICSDNFDCNGNTSKTLSSNSAGNISPGVVYDNAGNSVTCEGRPVYIDKTSPLVSASPSTVTIQEKVDYNVWTGVNYSDPESGITSHSASINSTASLRPGNYTITYTITNGSSLSNSASRTLIVKPNNIIKYRTRDYTGWSALTTTSCVSGELCQTGTLYKHRGTSTQQDIGGCGSSAISCDYTHSICNKDGSFYPPGNCDSASFCKGHTLWCVKQDVYRGTYLAGWGDWTSDYCGGGTDRCQVTTGYQTRGYGEWSAWSTNPCYGGSLCETKSCRADSPWNGCTPG